MVGGEEVDEEVEVVEVEDEGRRESKQIRDLNIDDNNLFNNRSDTIQLLSLLMPPFLLSLVVSERPVIGMGDEAKTPQYVRSDVIPSLVLAVVVDEEMSSSKCVV